MSTHARLHMSDDPTLADFERFHRRQQRVIPGRPTLRELGGTFFVAAGLTPFFSTLFLTLPMMGQIMVFFATVITLIYFVARRSVLVVLASLLGGVAFSSITFLTIQALKYRVDIPLFIFLVMGIPITSIYCIYISMKSWELFGGGE